MPTLAAVLSTALVPLTSLTSFSIYLAAHPSSPIETLVRRPIKLPIHRDEALDGTLEKDAFDLDDPVIFKDGYPVDAEKFWKKTWRLKLAFLLTMLLPTACNLVQLIFTAISDLEGEQKTRALLIPVLLVPAHLVTLLLGYWYLRQNETSAHWSTTIHLGVDVGMQFLIIAALGLLPSDPFPSSRLHGLIYRPHYTFASDPIGITRSLLPLLQLPPLIIILSIRRGPPLHFPLTAIYPPRINEAIPEHADGLDPTKANVSEEVQANIPDWLLFSYATNVVKKGANSDTMDVWDLPVLQASQRELATAMLNGNRTDFSGALPHYMRIKGIYGKQKKRLGRMEGFNLLIKIAKANKGPFIAREWPELLPKSALIAESVLAAVTAVGYYIPHYILKIFINYLENDPGRTSPAWGWLLAFGLLVSNVAINIVAGIIWSISTTTLQSGIRLQLNTLLFAKTLAKKDIAASTELKSTTNDEKDGSKVDDKEDDDEGVSSKSQIMTLFTVDVDRVTDFIWHEFALVDSPVEIAVATIFLLRLLGTSALYGLLATVCESSRSYLTQQLIVVCLPLNHIAGKVVVKAQENLMKSRDQRTGLMNEILQGIRMLK